MEEGYTRMICPPYELEADVERTRTYFEKHGKPAGQVCRCPGCRNFDRVWASAPAELLAFLRGLGIDPARPYEAINFGHGQTEPEGTLFYEVVYHAVGRITRQPDEVRGAYLPFGEGRVCFVGIGEHSMPLEKGFPLPAYEVDVDICLPYVLEDPPR